MPRERIKIECQDCSRQNYNITKNKKSQPGRVELKKFCRNCNRHTIHKETR